MAGPPWAARSSHAPVSASRSADTDRAPSTMAVDESFGRQKSSTSAEFSPEIGSISTSRGSAPTSIATAPAPCVGSPGERSEEHTSELQSRFDLVCRLLLEKKKKSNNKLQ